MYLCIRLILYLFSKISRSGFTSRSCVLPKHGSVARFILPGMFPPKKQVSNTIRKQLVTPILSMPLQYPGTYFTRTVVTVAGKVHSLVRLFMTVLFQQPNSILQYFESQPALINISGQVQINFSVFYKSCVWCSQQQNKTSYLFKVNKIQDIIQKTTILPSHLILYRANILSFFVLYGRIYIYQGFIWFSVISHILIKFYNMNRSQIMSGYMSTITITIGPFPAQVIPSTLGLYWLCISNPSFLYMKMTCGAYVPVLPPLWNCLTSIHFAVNKRISCL